MSYSLSDLRGRIVGSSVGRGGGVGVRSGSGSGRAGGSRVGVLLSSGFPGFGIGPVLLLTGLLGKTVVLCVPRPLTPATDDGCNRLGDGGKGGSSRDTSLSFHGLPVTLLSDEGSLELGHLNAVHEGDG